MDVLHFRGDAVLWIVRLTVLLVLAAGVAVLVEVGKAKGWISAEAGSWAQAIASLAAIWAAADVALLVPAMERRATRLSRLIGFRNLVAIAVKYVDEVYQDHLPGREQPKYVRRRELCRKAVETFPHGDIQPPSLIFVFGEVRLHCDRFWEEFMREWPEDAEERATIERRVRESRDELSTHLAYVDTVLRRSGAKFRDGIAYAPREGIMLPPQKSVPSNNQPRPVPAN